MVGGGGQAGEDSEEMQEKACRHDGDSEPTALRGSARQRYGVGRLA